MRVTKFSWFLCSQKTATWKPSEYSCVLLLFKQSSSGKWIGNPFLVDADHSSEQTVPKMISLTCEQRKWSNLNSTWRVIENPGVLDPKPSLTGHWFHLPPQTLVSQGFNPHFHENKSYSQLYDNDVWLLFSKTTQLLIKPKKNPWRQCCGRQNPRMVSKWSTWYIRFVSSPPRASRSCE